MQTAKEQLYTILTRCQNELQLYSLNSQLEILDEVKKLLLLAQRLYLQLPASEQATARYALDSLKAFVQGIELQLMLRMLKNMESDSVFISLNASDAIALLIDSVALSGLWMMTSLFPANRKIYDEVSKKIEHLELIANLNAKDALPVTKIQIQSRKRWAQSVATTLQQMSEAESGALISYYYLLTQAEASCKSGLIVAAAQSAMRQIVTLLGYTPNNSHFSQVLITNNL